jgi:hypothetical protein
MHSAQTTTIVPESKWFHPYSSATVKILQGKNNPAEFLLRAQERQHTLHHIIFFFPAAAEKLLDNKITCRQQDKRMAQLASISI